AHDRARGDRRRHLVDSFLPRPGRTTRRTGLHHSRLRWRDGLWKLPEPWTHRTRPPLLGKPHRTRFPTATTGTLIGNRELECYPCSRLTLLPMFPAAQHGGCLTTMCRYAQIVREI